MGFGLDQRYWSAQIPAVTAANEFITLDNRGTGRSSGSPVASIGAMADDAIRLLDHLGLQRAALLGVSMGGAIAQRMALDHGDRIEALVLVATWARPLEFMRRQATLIRRLVAGDDARSLAEASLVWMFSPRFFESNPEVIALVERSFAAESPRPVGRQVLLAQLEAIGQHDVIDQLGSISCRTLVVGGRFDMVVPGFASREIAAAIPGARLEMLDAGHGLMIEELESFNALIKGWLGDGGR